MLDSFLVLLEKVLHRVEHVLTPEFLQDAASRLMAPESLMAILSIVLIDLLLAGDNAVVIALAVQSLQPRQRRYGILLGAAFAVILRIILTFFAVKLLAAPYIKLLGGVLIIWIAIKLLNDSNDDTSGRKKARGVWQAVWMIVVADITMSTDNILAVAAASKGRLTLMAFGLLLSIPLVVFTSGMLSMLMARYKWIVWAGAALLGKVGAEMIITDKVVLNQLSHPAEVQNVAEAIGISVVLLIGWALRPKQPTS